MAIYIQYHNYDKEGLPLGDPADDFRIHTRLSHVQDAVGGQVFLIFGIGHPRRYFLWDSFTIENVTAYAYDDGKTAYAAFGPGWFLVPPQRLEGPEFDGFKSSCANFISFWKVDHLPFAGTLKRLADQHRSPGPPPDLQDFVRHLGESLRDDIERQALADHFLVPQRPTTKRKRKSPVGPSVEQVAVEPDPKPTTDDLVSPQRKVAPRKGKPTLVADAEKASDAGGQKSKGDHQQPQMNALSIRQPHAEAIMSGVKTTEYRYGRTKIRGRIYIYANLGRYSTDDEADMMAEYGIDDVACDDLPRGVIVGTVDLYDCDNGDWHVREPERAKTLRKPKNYPQPVWFKPF